MSWSAGGDVLFAYGDAGSFVSRFDGYPDVSAKTERVLSALTGRTDVIPTDSTSVRFLAASLLPVLLAAVAVCAAGVRRDEPSIP